MLKTLRKFDYKNLSFLYISCLLVVAGVFSVFRLSQFYLDQRERALLSTIRLLEQQRDAFADLERTLATGAGSKHVFKHVRGLQERQLQILAGDPNLRKACAGRPCERIWSPLSLDSVAEATRWARGPASSAYRDGVGDALSASIDLMYRKVQTDSNFDTIAFLSLILLLIIQAVYVFAPAVRKLNASLSTRSEFLSRISHEIRNPMNSIIGMADILKSTRLNSEQQQYIDNLLRSGHALLDMLNNLIDVSSVETGKLALKTGTFDIYKSLDRCVHLIAVQAHHKNLNVYVSLSPTLSNRLIGDSVRMEQVLLNLLNNAVKFTESGSIRLSIDVEVDFPESQQLLVSIEDTGIGIRREQLGEIFESFVQGDSSIQRKYGGSGLGLAIASELLRLMGGQLHVTSELGHGSRFYFQLRLDKADDGAQEPLAALAALAEQKIIFLTAKPEFEIYTSMFAKLQMPASVLASAGELKNRLDESSDVNQILIDDSVGIISMINCRNTADQFGLGDQAVALVRSNFTKENMDLLRRNGFTRFLIKPLKPWEMLQLPEREEAAATPGGHRPIISKLKEKNLRMLLVDDSNDNLFLLREVVQPLASTVHFAENGLDALEKFRANTYDVVFMDIQMPVMDGYTAIRKMRQLESVQKQSIPIYAVTAHSGLVDAQRCREAGFTDRIVKPVVRSDIYHSLSKAFEVDPAEIEDREADSDAIPAKYLKRLIPTYLKTRFEDMSRLHQALEGLDFKTVAQVGHKMKGSAASYGFPEVSFKSRELEFAAQAGDLERCQSIAQDLKRMFDEEGQKHAPL